MIGHDNEIYQDRRFQTCVFYVRKDEGVYGDLGVYQNLPVFFGDGDKTIIPIKSGRAMLRSGSLETRLEPHSGVGKLYILSVHFDEYYPESESDSEDYDEDEDEYERQEVMKTVFAL